MISADLATIRDNIKELVEKSAFMPQELRQKVLKKIADPQISREKILRIKALVDKINPEENRIIHKILEKDPLFFIRAKQEKSREILKKNREKEASIEKAELAKIEAELNNFLTA